MVHYFNNCNSSFVLSAYSSILLLQLLYQPWARVFKNVRVRLNFLTCLIFFVVFWYLIYLNPCVIVFFYQNFIFLSDRLLFAWCVRPYFGTPLLRFDFWLPDHMINYWIKNFHNGFLVRGIVDVADIQNLNFRWMCLAHAYQNSRLPLMVAYCAYT